VAGAGEGRPELRSESRLAPDMMRGEGRWQEGTKHPAARRRRDDAPAAVCAAAAFSRLRPLRCSGEKRSPPQRFCVPSSHSSTSQT
jgi:hypothetical protein